MSLVKNAACSVTARSTRRWRACARRAKGVPGGEIPVEEEALNGDTISGGGSRQRNWPGDISNAGDIIICSARAEHEGNEVDTAIPRPHSGDPRTIQDVVAGGLQWKNDGTTGRRVAG